MARKVATIDISNATEEDLSEYMGDLFEHGANTAEMQGMIGAAHRLVDTFSSLLNKKLWLKNGASPCTDGFQITVPYRHEFMYQFVEHELAHNLFQSSFTAKELFCTKYVEQIDSALKAHGKKLDNLQRLHISQMVGLMLNVLEDHRINTLWSTLYEGSYALMQEQANKLLKRVFKHGADDLISYFLLVAYKHPKLPLSKFEALQPAMASAVEKVAFKGPSATFVVGKWLLTKLVDFFLNQAQDQQQQSGASGGAGQPQQGQQGETQGESGEGAGDDAQQSAAPDQAQDNSQAQSPQAPAKPTDRIDALMMLVDAMQQDDAAKKASNRAITLAGDVQQGRFEKSSAAAEKRVAAALAIDMADASIDSFLKTSQAEMDKVLQDIQQVLDSSTSRRSDDDVMKRGVTSKVTFKDIKTGKRPLPMSSEDRRTVQRLKELFRRVHLNRTKVRYDSGSEVDIEAAIYNRVNNLNEPCFKDEGSGRGFKTLILVDRSGSMSGPKSGQAERACRMLRSSLKQPNIDVVVWGFSGDNGATLIHRITPNADVRESEVMPCGGNTPMGQAIRVATNYLSQGTQKKHLIVLTDGEPNASSSGVSYDVHSDDKSALAVVGGEVNRARKMGIHVTALSIGHNVKTAQMKQMFGSEKQWGIANQDSEIAPKLLKTAATSFVSYLKQA